MSSEEFTHVVAASGPAEGMTFTGRRRLVDGEVAGDIPLVIALHGGTYTSAYFDIAGYSLMDRAAAEGIPIIAIDRPGYLGSTPVQASDSIILTNAEVLDQVIDELWEAHGAGTAGVFLIGHSIGGAVVTALAAQDHAWPLLGMAVSGCLLKVATESRDAFNATPEVLTLDLPVPMKNSVMFGPDWTFASDMPEASYPSNAPVPRAELIDINNTWVERVHEVNAQVTVPVHVRHAEFDHLWITDAEQVRNYGASFSASSRVDAQLLPSTGHCIDFHRPSAGFQLSQLGFALECSVREAVGS